MRRFILLAIGSLAISALPDNLRSYENSVASHSPAIDLPSNQLTNYCGNYAYDNGDLEVGTVYLTDGRLMWSGSYNHPVIIQPKSSTRFVILKTGVEFDFNLNANGEAVALTFYGPRDQKFTFERIAAQKVQATSTSSPKGYSYSVPTPPSLANLAYASLSPKETLDLYLPTNPRGSSPLVIWIHGGHFAFGDKISMPRRRFGPAPHQLSPQGPFQIQVPDVSALLNKGYAVVSLNYRLTDHPAKGVEFQDELADAVKDAKAAVRFLRTNARKYQLDPDHFAVWGNSAGGYMAAMLGVTSDQPSIFDDPALGSPTISSAVQAVIVWYGSIDSPLFRSENRITHYIPSAKGFPPFLISQGGADRNVPPEFSRKLQTALTTANAISTLTIVPGAVHEDPAFMQTQMQPAFEFLDRAFQRN